MKTLVNTVIWMVLIFTGISGLLAFYWLLTDHPRLGVVLLVAVVSWGLADLARWPMK